jgi:pimeloyl-ACP methyl ester carboxylesterase
MKVQQPALFIAGSSDGVIEFMAKALEELPTTVPGLKKTLILPDSGHWIQQQRPAEVNAAILEFVRSA